MSLLIDVLGPVVVIVALGAVVGRRLSVNPTQLSSLAYWVLGPAFMFDLFNSSGLAVDVVVRLVAAAAVGMTAAVGTAFVGNRLVGSAGPVAAASLMTSSYGNVGNAGLAITVFALGEDALPAAGVLMLAINTLGILLGVGLAAGQRVGPGEAVRRALLAPMTIAAALAIGMNLASLEPPLVAERALGLMSGALIPMMLLTLGVQLALIGLGSWTADLTVTVVSKLGVAPLAATAAALAVGLDGDLAGAVAIQSAMPPAVFCMVVAMENDLEPERVTNAVVMTTLVSLVTLPVVLVLTQP